MHQIRSFHFWTALASADLPFRPAEDRQPAGWNRLVSGAKFAAPLAAALVFGLVALPAAAQVDADAGVEVEVEASADIEAEANVEADAIADADADMSMAAEADESETMTAPEETSSEEPDGSNVYVEYSLGVSVPLAQTLTGADGSGAGLSGRTKQNPGYTFGGAIGLRINEHFRAEFRIDYRASEVNRIALQGESSTSKGSLRLLSTMINGYYDHDLGVGIIPFIGFGMGWGRLDLGADNNGVPETDVADTDSVFVWNAMIGGTIPITDVTEFSLSYRYVQTEDSSLSGRVGGAPRRLDYEYDAHEVLMGLRFNF